MFEVVSGPELQRFTPKIFCHRGSVSAHAHDGVLPHPTLVRPTFLVALLPLNSQSGSDCLSESQAMRAGMPRKKNDDLHQPLFFFLNAFKRQFRCNKTCFLHGVDMYIHISSEPRAIGSSANLPYIQREKYT